MSSTPSQGRASISSAGSDATISPSPKSRQSLYAASKLANWSPSRAGSVSGQSDTANSFKSSGNIFQQATSALQTFAIESIISASSAPPRLPVENNKEPLSLPTTTKNFRGFVQKSGPIFWFQDGAIATVVWEDPIWTLMWMGIWVIISVYPWLLILAPSTILSIILIQTHRARFEDPMTSQRKAKETTKTQIKAGKANKPEYVPSPAEVLIHSTSRPTSTGEGDAKPPLVPNPPHEGSIKYYENLQDIQNMMRLVIDGYDAIAPTVPYLNWSSYTRTLHIFQGSILATILLFFVAPYIPYRLVMFLAGEGLFIMNHPWTLPMVQSMTTKITTSRESRKVIKVIKEGGHKIRSWIEQDRLDDHVWDKGWRNVEMFENERFQPTTRASSSSGMVGGWSAHNLNFGERKPWTKGADGWSSDDLNVIPGHSIDISRQVAMTLEPGWEWVQGEEWRIDWGGSWSSVGVDDEGYVYTDSSWQKPSPYPYGHGGGVPDYPPSIYDQLEDDEQDELLAYKDGDSIISSRRPLGAGVVNHDHKVKSETRRRRWLRRALVSGLVT